MKAPELGDMMPANKSLLWGVVCVQVALVVGPIYFAGLMFWAVPIFFIALSFLLFSVERTLPLLLAVTIVLPSTVLSDLVLPGGVRLQEAFLLVACFFALVDWVYRRHLRISHTPADGPVLFFLLVTCLSVGIGYLYGNEVSVIWRDARFPLYYVAFFVVSYFVSGRSALRYYVPLLVVLGLVVAAGYVLEFVGAIDLSVGERFVRVARLQGMVLPIALLLVVSELVFAPRRWGRPLLLLLFIPIGLAFVLTVGRSMWAVFLIGLVCIAFMNGRLRGGNSRWRSAALIVALLALLVGIVFSFQRFTGASIGAQVFERSRTLVEYEENVHVMGRIFSYAVALEASAEHPLLGHGQGKTLMLLNFNEEMLRFDWTRAWTIDSLYLTILVKMGVLGLIGFFWMYGRIMKLAWHAFHQSNNPHVRSFCAASFALLMGMLALGIGNASMINGRFALVYAILFGMVAVIAREVSDGDAHAGTE